MNILKSLLFLSICLPIYGMHKCPGCPRTATEDGLGDLIGHIQTKHGISAFIKPEYKWHKAGCYENEKRQPSILVTHYICKWFRCERVFTTKDAARRHVQEHWDKGFLLGDQPAFPL